MIKIQVGKIDTASAPIDATSIANINICLAQLANIFNSQFATKDWTLNAVISTNVTGGATASAGAYLANGNVAGSPVKNIVQSKLIDGLNPNATASNTMDFGLNIGTTFIQSVNSSLLNGDLDVNGNYNKIYVFLHEFGHVLGITDARDSATGKLYSANISTIYDQYIKIIGTDPYFTGKYSTAIYGDDIPLVKLGNISSISHLTTRLSDGSQTKIDGATEVMVSGTASTANHFYGDLDVAIFKDLGYTNLNTITSLDKHTYIPGSLTTYIAASTALNDKVIIDGGRNEFSLSRQGSNFVVSKGSDNSKIVLSEMETVQFKDMSINLQVGEDSQKISTTSLNKLVDLYIAFFNRVPDGAGLDYWINQVHAGVSLDAIANNFYLAGLQFGAITGYTALSTNQDFVNNVYAVVLGRTEQTKMPDPEGVKYWTGKLDTGTATKASLVNDMIGAAYTFANDPIWGWVPKLLANKEAVGLEFAVHQGISYLDPALTITKTVEIAHAVTSTDISAAIALIGVSDAGWTTV